MQDAQGRCRSGGPARLVLAAAMLAAGVWLAPAKAADQGTMTAEAATKTERPAIAPAAAPAPAPLPAARPAPAQSRPVAAKKAPTRPAPRPRATVKRHVPVMRVAEANPPPRRQSCFLFVCWPFIPIIHGVTY